MLTADLITSPSNIWHPSNIWNRRLVRNHDSEAHTVQMTEEEYNAYRKSELQACGIMLGLAVLIFVTVLVISHIREK